MILVAGSANLDFVVRAPHIPAPGETVLGRHFNTFPGGKGANQAIACARAAAVPTAMLAALGKDAFAEPLIASLEAAGVRLHAVHPEGLTTGTAFICVSDNGENAITVAPGANAGLAPEHLIPLDGFTHLLLQLETPMPTVLAYARAARRAGLQVVLNAAPAQPLPAELLQLLDLLIVNEGELAAIAGHNGSLRQQLERIQVPMVVVTLGAAGCVARHPGGIELQPAFRIEPVDSTAAGDTFCGALVGALSRGLSLAQALTMATAASALSCLTLGAQSSIPERAAVLEFMSQHPLQTDTDALTRRLDAA
jgi:ribokinase